MRFRKVKLPIAEPFTLINFFVEIPGGDRIQSMPLFDVARRNHLTREQRIEQPNDIDAEIVLYEFRVELRIMRNLDGPRRGNQSTQRRYCLALRQVAVEAVEIDYVNAVRRRELD